MLPLEGRVALSRFTNAIRSTALTQAAPGLCPCPVTRSQSGSRLIAKKRFYILFVSRDPDGTLNKVPVPLHYAWVFVAAAAIGLFTIAGMAGSYSRMLIKTARFNQLRHDHDTLKKDYATLAQQAQEKDVQAASLGALATEVSSLYGLTANKLTTLHVVHGRTAPVVKASNDPASAALKDSSSTLTSESYFKSIDAFYSLRDTATDGQAARMLLGPANLGRMDNPLMPGHPLRGLGSLMDGSDADFVPTLWPVTGRITSSFGEREDPVLGNGDGEFHAGIDIAGDLGEPIHATADGVVVSVGVVNGYGRMVKIDHGHGLETWYGHMSGFAVTAGQQVARGEVIGYIGHSGRTTGNHVHYEVRIHNVAVNPHRFLRSTLAQLTTAQTAPAVL